MISDLRQMLDYEYRQRTESLGLFQFAFVLAFTIRCHKTVNWNAQQLNLAFPSHKSLI
jgi:hypothetical protein